MRPPNPAAHDQSLTLTHPTKRLWCHAPLDPAGMTTELSPTHVIRLFPDPLGPEGEQVTLGAERLLILAVRLIRDGCVEHVLSPLPPETPSPRYGAHAPGMTVPSPLDVTRTFPDPLGPAGHRILLGGQAFLILEVLQLADGVVRHLLRPLDEPLPICAHPSG
ncbi:hypothetical protein DAETH_48390 (plasmid) [Deinococcus aetherius]|uniref:Uncharacterized protein n=1 Tax=Deinococcus aetherius TaxID=200252 RepID=A0ABN6RNK1_9DEIO|nr:hypothetical protein [Deinococcus aetherius]BDP44870.1 hypothetical protein DAETH_48390 [Deinococcus aetherius]